jgi:GNAT superfamily N-acetyltransferase
MDIEYREARKKDCPIMAEYIYSASDGLLDYLFEGIIPGMTVAQLLTHGLEDENRYNSVHKEFRYKGIGATFISLAKSKAESLDFQKLSLFVLADNITARKVYHSNGFKIIKEIGFKDEAKINHEGGFYSMACDI